MEGDSVVPQALIWPTHNENFSLFGYKRAGKWVGTKRQSWREVMSVRASPSCELSQANKLLVSANLNVELTHVTDQYTRLSVLEARHITAAC